MTRTASPCVLFDTEQHEQQGNSHSPQTALVISNETPTILQSALPAVSPFGCGFLKTISAHTEFSSFAKRHEPCIAPTRLVWERNKNDTGTNSVHAEPMSVNGTRMATATMALTQPFDTQALP